MDYYRNTSIIVGILFITATITSILSSVFLGSTLNAPISLSMIHSNSNNIIISLIL